MLWSRASPCCRLCSYIQCPKLCHHEHEVPSDRDPGWADVKGYRGAQDIENPVGEWNTMEIACHGSSINVWVNGDHVNNGFDCTVDEGQIAIQAEGAEAEFRKVELTYLGSAKLHQLQT